MSVFLGIHLILFSFLTPSSVFFGQLQHFGRDFHYGVQIADGPHRPSPVRMFIGHVSEESQICPTVPKSLDQMLLVEGFYGTGPVIGILTTGEEWVVSWFPGDTDILAETNHTEASYSMPLKSTSTVSTESNDAQGYRPPGGTLSQQSGAVHNIEILADDQMPDDNAETLKEVERLLCTTKVMNIHLDSIPVLQVLCSALQMMANSCTHNSSILPRCLLKFHKDTTSVTYHPLSYEEVQQKVDFNKFPQNDVETLVALEDLGRGENGKAWLCVTDTLPFSAVCVLKFNNNGCIWNLRSERNKWHLLYPEFKDMVKVEMWSGANALPRNCAI